MRVYAILFFIVSVGAGMLCGMEIDNLQIKKSEEAFYFEVSLIPPYTKIQIPITGTQHDYFFKIVPEIGLYGSPYLFSQNRAFIQFRPESANVTIPDSIRKNIPFLESAHVDYNCIVQVYDKNEANLVFHPWVRTWVKNFTPPKQTVFFNVTVPMGIFEADGVSPVSKNGVAFGKISHQTVNAHGPEFAFSPNNARFALDTTRAISDFWVVAYSPDKKNVCICFVVLINSHDAEQKLKHVFFTSQTLGDFINAFKKTAPKFTGKDQTAILHSANTILAIAQNQRVSSSLTSNQSSPAQELLYALERFTKALYRLKKWYT